MIVAFANLTWPVFADALALGGIYALMAVGIGLVFGVLRLVNFAYGQLMMAGAFALAYGDQWGLPNWLSILFCFGVVLGGLNRPIPATLGGFSIGFAFGLLGGILPSNQSQYLPSFIFAAVIVVLLVRPNGLFTRGGAAVERV